MSQKHSAGVVRAAELVEIKANEFDQLSMQGDFTSYKERFRIFATIIDREAVQPAVKELLEALKKIKKILTDPNRVMPCLAVDVAAFALAKFDPPVDTETESKERGDPSTEA